MRLLLDENLPKRLKLDLPEHEVYTVNDMGWNGKKNGELIELLLADNFDALFTFDKNLQYQQNFKKYAVPVLVLHAPDNTYKELSRLLPRIKIVLAEQLLPGPIIINE